MEAGANQQEAERTPVDLQFHITKPTTATTTTTTTTTTDHARTNLAELFAKARELTELSVAAADRDERAIAEAMAKRLRAESTKLLDTLLGRVPTAILDAAANGKRVATLLEFSGGDLFEEFCYLYMVKGPHTQEGRAEMKRAGVEPLLDTLRRTLHPAGFTVWHSWQRATNQNLVTVSW